MSIVIPNQLRTAAKKLPPKSGIYIFKGRREKILYVGKALNLKNRVNQYIKTGDFRLQKMVAEAQKIYFVETDSDIEALILESQYIKKYKPMFNIMLRDDKQFGFVGFTKEAYPKIFITHQPEKNQNAKIKMQNDNAKFKNFKAKFIGPFMDGVSLKTTLRYLRKIFPYCTCKQLHHNYCLNYHIGKCPGFCCLKSNQKLKIKNQNDISKIKNYQKNIRIIKDILSGKKSSLLKGLEKEMIKLGKKERFNEAIEMRDKIEKIKRVFENAAVIQRNTNLQMHTNTANVLNELKKTLKLSTTPHRIEGYDIANIQGKHAVGAMVVFLKGIPSKNEYRKFKIGNVDISTFRNFEISSGGDTAMLKEILKRRLNHSEWPLPNLILIDGGKAQLNAAHSTISNFKFLISKQIPVIALTKDEKHRGNKIFVAGKKNSISLSKLPADAKNLLLHVDSEAHRFAIAYYRHRHQKELS